MAPIDGLTRPSVSRDSDVSPVITESGCLTLGIGSVERGSLPKKYPDEFRRRCLISSSLATQCGK
ncbi:MAG: hypothetical protein CMH33_06810 [Microbacterium sp.]|nr:hypothetical protein [Microbacterium sp.]MAM53384.1 hypothetical protein [Microbacterium sp.]